MRIEKFDEVGVVGTVRDGFVCKEFVSSSVNVHDNSLTKENVLTSLDENVVKRVTQFFVVLVFVEHAFLECVEKVSMSGIGTDVKDLSNVFEIMVLA